MTMEVLRIHCIRYDEEIFPWIQRDLMTPYWRFYWNPVPGGCLQAGGERVALEPEFFYVIPGYFRFSTFAERPFRQFYIHFNPDCRLPLWRGIVKIPAAPEWTALLTRFIDTPEDGRTLLYRTLIGETVLRAALLTLEPERFLLPPHPEPRIGALLAEIERDRGRTRSNDELARFCGMSRNGFCRLFRRETGESPQDFCRRKRIELACELLHFSDGSIEEIAEQTGFADRYHFTRVFSRTLRTTPALFRKSERRSQASESL